jgi:hypothetical protein
VRRGVTVNSGVRATLERFRIQNGFTQWGSGWDAGGLVNNGDLALQKCVVRNNTGRGISNNGILLLNESAVISNTTHSGYDGAGIYCGDGTFTTLNASTVSENTTGEGGDGGGIYVYRGRLVLNNSTVSGNTASGVAGGGGIIGGASVTLYNSTITANVALYGGGILGSIDTMSMRNTIVADNRADFSPDCGYVTSLGHNLIGNTATCLSAPSDLTDVDARLAPLADNGGPTWTHALLADSPAIDAADNAACADPATVNNRDQRGYIRPADGNSDGVAVCDIGAYEHLGGRNGLAVWLPVMLHGE